MKKRIDFKYLFIVFSIIILTLPVLSLPFVQRINTLVDYIKLIDIIMIFFLYFISKKKLNRITFLFLILFTLLFFLTVINNQSIIYYLKTYSLNFAIILLMDYSLDKYKNKIILFISNYNLLLLLLNLFTIILSLYFKTNNYMIYSQYLLGFDNRFILYIICPIIGFNYLFSIYNSIIYKKRLILSLLIGLISLIIVWSVAAMFSMIIMIIFYFISKNIKRIKINIHFIEFIFLILSILISFFSFQTHFSYIIETVLNKSLDLSYRTIIWNKALLFLSLKPIHYIYGYGFFDTSNLLIIDRLNVGVIHCHNLVINNLLFGGILWSFYYYKILYFISSIINNCSKSIKMCNLSVYIGLLILLIFDTFEYYAIYYLILYLLYITSVSLNVKE